QEYRRAVDWKPRRNPLCGNKYRPFIWLESVAIEKPKHADGQEGPDGHRKCHIERIRCHTSATSFFGSVRHRERSPASAGTPARRTISGSSVLHLISGLWPRPERLKDRPTRILYICGCSHRTRRCADSPESNGVSA